MGPTLKEKRRQKKLAAAQAVAKEDSSSSDSSDSSDDDSSVAEAAPQKQPPAEAAKEESADESDSDDDEHAPAPQPESDDDDDDEPRALERPRASKAQAHIRTVFVGNLPFAATEAPLCDLFFPGGEGAEHEETDVEVKRDVESGKSRGFAVVTLPDADACLAFVDKWADADFEGRKLVVRLERKGVKARPGKPKRRRDDADARSRRRGRPRASARPEAPLEERPTRAARRGARARAPSPRRRGVRP
ncbi:hypothetical protein JL722_6255 [Aureococcus anophagefferens]|nr:hypothetical protein JL722_6255 [Aureococcus anophagefferens]